MNTFETFATVGDLGQVRIVGVPFATGTLVQVSISAKVRPEESSVDVDGQALAAARARMQQLFRTITGFRMTTKIAREDVYERGRVYVDCFEHSALSQ